MSSLGTDIIAALWKGPKVAMLVIVEGTLAEPKERKSLLIEHKADRSDPNGCIGAQNNAGLPQRLAGRSRT